MTIIILVFGEITPKVYAKHFNEPVSFLLAPLLDVLMVIFRPAVIIITFISNKILYYLGVDISKIKRPLMTEAEVQTCILMGWYEGAITEEERQMLSKVFTLNDKAVCDIMVPRDKMITIPLNASFRDTVKTIVESDHTRLPVRKKDGEEIAGFIHAKDVFRLMEEEPAAPLENIVRKASFVPWDRKIDVQLRHFQAEKIHMAIVVDQSGNVAGIATLEDILEELVGTIRDEHD